MKILTLRHILRIVLIFVAVFLLLGCQSRVDQKDLIGVYEVQYPYGMEQLHIRPDGSYEQLFALKGQALKSINDGKWEISYSDGQELVLNNPVIVDDGFGKLSAMRKETGIWPLHFRKGISGRMFFPINEDQGFVFEKKQ